MRGIQRFNGCIPRYSGLLRSLPHVSKRYSALGGGSWAVSGALVAGDFKWSYPQSDRQRTDYRAAGFAPGKADEAGFSRGAGGGDGAFDSLHGQPSRRYVLTHTLRDRHVLATALIAKAQVIVTDNLKHFPSTSLSQFRVEAQSADQFLTYLYDLFPDSMVEVLQTQAGGLRNPPMSVDSLLDLLQKSVPTFVSRCR